MARWIKCGHCGTDHADSYTCNAKWISIWGPITRENVMRSLSGKPPVDISGDKPAPVDRPDGPSVDKPVDKPASVDDPSVDVDIDPAERRRTNDQTLRLLPSRLHPQAPRPALLLSAPRCP